MNRRGLPGVTFRPMSWRPFYANYQGKSCGGVQIHVTDRVAFQPVRASLTLLAAMRELSGEHFAWRRETYEFVSDRLAIDLLAGSARYRELVERGGNIDEWVAEWEEPLRAFAKTREEFLLYRAADAD